MGIYAIKPKFQQLLRPVEGLLVRWRVHPTTINILALLLSVLGGFALYFADRQIWLLLYIPVMAFVRTALNALDGMVARDLDVPGQAWGEVLNETLDRISDAAIFFGLALASYANLALGALVVILILISSYLGIVCKAAGGRRMYYGLIGKADRMIYVGAMAVLILIFRDYRFADWLLWFLAIGMTVTIIQRFLFIKRELEQKEAEQKQTPQPPKPEEKQRTETKQPQKTGQRSKKARA